MTLNKIILQGDLAEKFAPEIEANVDSVYDAIDLLQANFSSFRSHLIQSEEMGYGYYVWIGEWQIEEKHLGSPVGMQTIVILPVVIGAGGAFGKIILGVGLIALGVFTGGVGFIPASTLILVGSTLALNGIMGLFQTPQVTKEEQEKKNSLLFGNVTNVAGAGSRTGVCYGLIEATSMVLSAGIRSDFILDDSEEED